MAHKILIVDDEKNIGFLLETFLKKEGFEPYYVATGKEALKLFEKQPFDLILLDIKMPDINGIELLKHFRNKNPRIKIIMITAYPSIETAVEAMKEEAFDYVIKPIDLDELKKLIERALKKEKSISAEKVIHYGNIVARSPVMLRLLEKLPRIAATKANVLIMGESGTGKELIARAIHNLSPRRNKPFVAVNCAGIPETLLESELFGYRKGAFTGAMMDRIGLFQSADQGTIFLDEIGDLSPTLQVKLLRVVEEKCFKPLGSNQEVQVDVRIISATNRNLEQEVISGRFREDLYYRLNVIPIRVPPLRERKEDIPILIEYFLEKYSKELGKEVRHISASALSLLMEYDFPGNVRELENIIERCVALETSNIILPESLIISTFKKKKTLSEEKAELPLEGIDLEEKLASIEKQLLIEALKKAKGVKTEAAKLLNLSFRSFRYKLQKYGLDSSKE
ncbi:MAG: sigma-54 dependent transcriptional regulator [Candidatus Desulfofervidus auxilii]|nr:sigma-54 dependent transcriptional regulator [Candidatus Desulfofervidus auxilii]